MKKFHHTLPCHALNPLWLMLVVVALSHPLKAYKRPVPSPKIITIFTRKDNIMQTKKLLAKLTNKQTKEIPLSLCQITDSKHTFQQYIQEPYTYNIIEVESQHQTKNVLEKLMNYYKKTDAIILVCTQQEATLYLQDISTSTPPITTNMPFLNVVVSCFHSLRQCDQDIRLQLQKISAFATFVYDDAKQTQHNLKAHKPSLLPMSAIRPTTQLSHIIQNKPITKDAFNFKAVRSVSFHKDMTNQSTTPQARNLAKTLKCGSVDNIPPQKLLALTSHFSHLLPKAQKLVAFTLNNSTDTAIVCDILHSNVQYKHIHLGKTTQEPYQTNLALLQKGLNSYTTRHNHLYLIDLTAACHQKALEDVNFLHQAIHELNVIADCLSLHTIDQAKYFKIARYIFFIVPSPPEYLENILRFYIRQTKHKPASTKMLNLAFINHNSQTINKDRFFYPINNPIHEQPKSLLRHSNPLKNRRKQQPYTKSNSY